LKNNSFHDPTQKVFNENRMIKSLILDVKSITFWRKKRLSFRYKQRKLSDDLNQHSGAQRA